MEFDGPIYQTKIQLTPEIPLHVYLVKGPNYAVWIDTEFRSLGMVAAHVADLIERGIVREVATQTYTLR